MQRTTAPGARIAAPFSNARAANGACHLDGLRVDCIIAAATSRAQAGAEGICDAGPFCMSRYRIVVAIDLSEYAEVVLEHALDQAARHDQSELHFVTVVPDARLMAVTKKRLADIVRDGLDVFRDGHVDWRARMHVRVGKPAEEIVALADDVEADLIVVGRFSQHRRRVGSTAQRVLDLASSPTLAINQLGKSVAEHAQCPDCARVRSSSDGEVWFCDRHRDRDRDTLATTLVLPSTIWTGGTLMW
jgi:nucleotide-binding universal stress UspA family protein